MIKFNVLKRFSSEIAFTAEIECAEDALTSIKLGLAVKWAIKARANLADANLADANLARANLAGANLADANLAGANLARAKWHDGIIIQKAPIYIAGLTPYRVTILDQHMQIGCELHSLAEWDAFDDRRIIAMDGRAAADFWKAHKEGLLAIARGARRSFEPIEQKAEAA